MKKKIYFLGFAFSSLSIFAQVGIGTSTPTEKLDVEGTLRIRSLPDENQANAIYTTGPNSNSGTNPTQTYTGKRPVVADAQGVLGLTNRYSLVTNATNSASDTSNLSTATFVVKRFMLDDSRPDPANNALTIGGKYATEANGFDTGMEVSRWQAIISNISFKLLTETNNARNIFKTGQPFNYRLHGPTGGNWRIVGDILFVREQAYVDVLFIKSDIVAAEPRNNVFP